MTIILQDFSDLKDEILKMIAFEAELEKESVLYFSNIDSTQLLPCLKSSIILMLYNAVESTCTKCLSKIHETVRNKKVKFSELNDELKKIVLAYYDKAIDSQKSSNDFSTKINYELSKINMVLDNENFLLTFDKMSEFYSLYSGNLDAKEIRTTLKKYDITFEEKASELHTIKTDRNNLSHGSKTFEDVGRDKSYQQLQVMAERTFLFLENMIDAVQTYLDDEGYKKSHTTDAIHSTEVDESEHQRETIE